MALKARPLLVIILSCASAFAAVRDAETRPESSSSLLRQENKHWATVSRNSRFSTITNAASRTTCERTVAPEALATPNPLVDAGQKLKIVVSIIIGTDGQVHSPFILESAGPVQDNTILSTVRAWRFRPAMCNGSPAESEGKIEFSRR